MAKGKMTTCKTCGAEIAKSAKSCPHCGAKNKKTIFKRWWFWVLVIVLLVMIGNAGKQDKQKDIPSKSTNSGKIVANVETSKPAQTIATEPQMAETEATQTDAPVTEETVPTNDSGDIDPEFKAAMDAYESFYVEYCDLLKKYMANPTDLSLLTKYADMMSRAEQMNQAFEAWNEDEMNNEELKYYLDVNNRVMKMLVDIGG